MGKIILLEYIFEIDDEEHIKFIGASSSVENANNVVNQFKNLPGFKDRPLYCFKINTCKVDEYEWKSGFISWKEARE